MCTFLLESPFWSLIWCIISSDRLGYMPQLCELCLISKTSSQWLLMINVYSIPTSPTEWASFCLSFHWVLLSWPVLDHTFSWWKCSIYDLSIWLFLVICFWYSEMWRHWKSQFLILYFYIWFNFNQFKPI